MYYSIIGSKAGRLLVSGDEYGIQKLSILFRGQRPQFGKDWKYDRLRFTELEQQLSAYFEGKLTAFNVPLSPEGTPFQHQVWKAVRAIPYGCVATYRELACQIGKPRSYRAVGLANARNPIPILIPCHRVIGTGGRLRGYIGGLDKKKFLLRLEGIALPEQQELASAAQLRHSSYSVPRMVGTGIKT